MPKKRNKGRRSRAREEARYQKRPKITAPLPPKGRKYVLYDDKYKRYYCGKTRDAQIKTGNHVFKVSPCIEDAQHFWGYHLKSTGALTLYEIRHTGAWRFIRIKRV